MKKTIILITLIFALTGYGYSHFAANYSCEVFTPNQCTGDGGDGAMSRSSSPLLGQLITISAGYFLASNSDFQLFLNKIELSEIYNTDFANLKMIIDKATVNMELANATYYEIWETSKTLEYNPVVLEKLRQFDYFGYQAENNLNPAIFQQVVGLLRSGDIRAAYEKFYYATGEILEGLKKVKTMVDSNTIPKIADLWQINRQYLFLEIFGQHISEVFYMVK